MASGSVSGSDRAARCTAKWSSVYNGGTSYTITFSLYGGTNDGYDRNCWAYIDYGERLLDTNGKTSESNYLFGRVSVDANANINGKITFPDGIYFGVGFDSPSAGTLEATCSITSITVEKPITAPSTPTNIVLTGGENTFTNNEGIYGSSSKTNSSVLTWDEASPGLNTSIIGYIIYQSINGAGYTKLASITADKTNYSVDISALANGEYATYKVVTQGKSIDSRIRNSGQSQPSIKFYKNTPPSAPIGQPTFLPSTGGQAALNYIPGTSPNNFNITTYYTNDPSGNKELYDGQLLEAGTYYLWSYDGLDYSNSYATISIIKDTGAPVVSAITCSNSNFSPYYNEGKGYEYVTVTTPIITGSSGQNSSISNYLFYYKQASNVDSLNSSKEIYIGQSNSNSISFIVNNYIIAGNYFQIGAKIQTSLGEESDIRWSNIMCSGAPITADDFDSNLIIDSLLDNDKNSILDNTGIILYFNRWVKISWTNPLNKINKFRIIKIECGIIAGTSFTPIAAYTKSGEEFNVNLSNGMANSNIYLDINNTVVRGKEISLAIRITSEDGTISIKAGEKRTRTLALSFGSEYNVSIPEWKYFLDGSEINFNGNKIIGDNGFAILKSATITSENPSNKIYPAIYTTDNSSIPGHFNFEDFAIFKAEINSNKTDNIINNTYVITVIDRYGNTSNSRISQIIDYRIAPDFPVDAVLTTKVAYLNSPDIYSVVGNNTSISYRILNPGEKIEISWPEATDSGNSEGQIMRYRVEGFNIPNITSLSTTGGTKFLTDIIESTSYIYTVPNGTNAAQGVYFNVTALDQTDLTSKTLSTSSSQALALGRALAPEFSIINYSIEEEGANAGMLTGRARILDYGDSRSIVSTWKNYDRLGITLTELGGKLDQDQKPILVTLSYNTETENFTSNIGDYPTKDKITLNFTLSVNYLGLFSDQYYIFSFNGPTFSYRAHQIGINASADNVNNTSLIIGPGVANGVNKHLVRFIINKLGWQDIDIDLYEGTIKNIIIDGGTWDQI